MKIKFSGTNILPNGTVFNNKIIADPTRYFEGEPDGDDMIIRVGEESIIVSKESLKVEIL